MNSIATSIIQELQKQNDRLNKIVKELYYFFICIYVHILFIIRTYFNPV